MGALGDGGAIVTNDSRLAEHARQYRNYGSSGKYVHDIAGANSRLDELQAAFLWVRLRRLDGKNARRREIAAVYRERLGVAGLELPRADRASEHVYHLFVVRTPDRDALAAALDARGIATMVHYPCPPHRQRAFANAALRAPLPVTETLAGEVLSVPLWPAVTESQIDHVVAPMREVLDHLDGPDCDAVSGAYRHVLTRLRGSVGAGVAEPDETG